MMRKVVIVIVNYRSASMTISAMDAVAANLHAGEMELIIVDNDSQDESVAMLCEAVGKKGLQDSVRIIESRRNGGFAAGNNVAIAELLRAEPPPQYVWLLNPDTVAEPQAGKRLVDFLDSHPRAGIAGGVLLNETGGMEQSGHRFPSPIGEFPAAAQVGPISRMFRGFVDEPMDLGGACRHDWISGASMMVRTEVFRSIGLMDEGYFLYFEEVDFCRRAAREGWEVWLEPASRVLHMEGSCTGIQQKRMRRTPHWFASRRRYFAKFHGIPGLILADVFWLLGRLTWTLRALLEWQREAIRDQPRRLAGDLLLGDLRAMVRGEVSSLGKRTKAS